MQNFIFTNLNEVLIEKCKLCVDNTDYGQVLNFVSSNVKNMTSVYNIINYIFSHPDLLSPKNRLNLEMEIQTLKIDKTLTFQKREINFQR